MLIWKIICLEVSLQTKTLYQCESKCEGECESYFAEASKDKKKRVSLFALNYTLYPSPYTLYQCESKPSFSVLTDSTFS